MDIISHTLTEHGGNKLEAGAALAHRLMEGDPEQFKQGYDDEAAAFGAATAYELTDAERLIVLAMIQPKPAVPQPGDLDFAHGLHHDEWYIYQWNQREVPEGSWNPIAGPYPCESDARLAYAEQVDAAAWALDAMFGEGS